MNLHTVITATTDDPLYRDFAPIFHRAWKKLFPEIQVIILFINEGSTSLTDPLLTNFASVDGVDPVFQSQCVRLLWPALLANKKGLSDDDAVLITDIDMIPLSRDFYTKTAANLSTGDFSCLRNVIAQLYQYPICYNIATPATWGEIFQIQNENDIREKLKYWFDQITYEGTHGGVNWSFDQAILFQTLSAWEHKQKTSGESRLVLFNDEKTGFKRLDRLNTDTITTEIDTILNIVKKISFSDFHMPRPYLKYKEFLERIVDAI